MLFLFIGTPRCRNHHLQPRQSRRRKRPQNDVRSCIHGERGTAFVAYANNELDADKDIAIVSW